MLNVPEEFREGILISIILIVAWFCLKFKRIFFRRIKQKRLEGKHTLDSRSAHLIEKIISVAIFFVSLMAVLQVLGLDILPLLTVSGIGAAILGFASKDMVSNFFGGTMIYLTRPFSVDEQIEIPSKSLVGYVEEIGWYLTTIRDMQKKLLYIPNAVFSTEVLINYSRMTHRRMEEKIRLPSKEDAELKLLVDEIRAFVAAHPGIDHKEEVDVFVISINPWGVMMEVKAYTKATKYAKYMEVKQDILLKIYSVAFPKPVQATEVRT